MKGFSLVRLIDIISTLRAFPHLLLSTLCINSLDFFSATEIQFFFTTSLLFVGYNHNAGNVSTLQHLSTLAFAVFLINLNFTLSNIDSVKLKLIDLFPNSAVFLFYNLLSFFF